MSNNDKTPVIVKIARKAALILLCQNVTVAAHARLERISRRWPAALAAE